LTPAATDNTVTMSFELDPTASATKAVRKVARQRLDTALELLSGLDSAEQAAIEEAVHDVRKRCKEVRSLARLVRSSIGDAAFRSFNSAVRDAASELAPIRDSHAVLETFGDLITATGSERDRRLATVRAAHAEEAERATQLATSDVARIERAQRLLRGAQRMSRKWSLPGGFARIADGIETVYRAGRRTLDVARHEPTDVAVHEWRKSVKHLYHALQLIEAAAPSMLSPLVEQLDHLGDALGDDHDLAVLVERLGDAPEAHGGAVAVAHAVDMARTEQADLRRRAFRLGQAIYAEKPAAFRRRLERYWQVTQTDGQELKTGKISAVGAPQTGT
jgi:CHAD domain-containing protein